MYLVIKKTTKDIVAKFTGLPAKIKVPGTNDVVFAPTPPMDIGPNHVLVEAVVTDPAYDPDTQVRTGPVFVVANDFSTTETYTVRPKTAQEIDDEKDEAVNGALSQRGLKAFIKCVDDGSIVPGANVGNAALKAAIKAKM
jgi:hypothetical protein